MALLEVRKLSKNLGGRQVLDGLDLSLARGEVKVIMGPSGCGKSTLLRCLNRLVEPDSGQIIFDGEDITGPKTDVRALRQRIGFVFQQFALYRHLSVLDNVTLALRKLRRLTASQAAEKAMHELARVDMHEHHLKYPAQLSGGQKQRVAIARALAMDPAVLFFDEPTSALDPLMSREIVAVINQLYLDDVTMLCVTHDTFVARYIADRLAFMDAGRIRAEDRAERMFHDHPDPKVRDFFRLEAQGR
jgi:polar amino acid transport system ATP-binding protein